MMNLEWFEISQKWKIKLVINEKFKCLHLAFLIIVIKLYFLLLAYIFDLLEIEFFIIVNSFYVTCLSELSCMKMEICFSNLLSQ